MRILVCQMMCVFEKKSIDCEFKLQYIIFKTLNVSMN